MADPHRQLPPLTLVAGTQGTADHPDSKRAARSATSAAGHDLEWSILMARAQEGDAAAYRRLLEEVTPYLRSIAARWHRDASDVEDAVQDVLLTLHAIRQTYDPTRPFGPWLVTVARRRLVDRLRRQGRIRSRETALAVERETFSTGQANIDEEISDRHELAAALDGLPSSQQLAIRLLKLEGLSLKEAAARTGMSISALKVATHRALKALRNRLTPRSKDRSEDR